MTLAAKPMAFLCDFGTTPQRRGHVHHRSPL